MLDPATLRGRLTLVYASALLLSIAIFAAATLLLIVETQRQSLDQRLSDTGHAVASILDDSDGRLSFDVKDRMQFARVVGVALNAAVVDGAGRTLISTAATVPPAIEAAMFAPGGIERYATLASDGDRVRVFVERIGPAVSPHGAVVVWRDVETVAVIHRRTALAYVVLLAVVLVVAVAAGSAVAERGLRPLSAMADVASEIEAHDLSARLELPPRPDELGRLAATFDRMLDRLQDAFARERRFTSDASHEIRAPLAVIRAEADLALRRERSGSEYRRALEVIAAEADALEALTRSLLAAARSDEREHGVAEPVDVSAIAVESVERLRVLAENRRVEMSCSGADQTVVAGHSGDISRAVIAVVHNAVKYAPVGGHVRVAVRRAAARVELEVLDDGRGFSRDALLHAAERFWRDDPARGREGTGLGLPIAKALVEASSGTLSISNVPGGGACVVIAFPAAHS